MHEYLEIDVSVKAPYGNICSLTNVSISKLLVQGGSEFVGNEVANILREFLSLTFFNSHKNARELTVVKCLNLNIGKGEIVGLVDTNGLVKAGLLDVFGLCEPPDTGEYTVNGRIIFSRQFGMFVSRYRSVKDNLYLFSEACGFSKKEIFSALDVVSELEGLDINLDLPFRRLEKSNIDIIFHLFSVAIKPELLVLDNFLSTNSSIIFSAYNDLMAKLLAEGCSIISCTSSEYSLKNVVNRLIFIDESEEIYEGSFVELSNKFGQSFLSHCSKKARFKNFSDQDGSNLDEEDIDFDETESRHESYSENNISSYTSPFLEDDRALELVTNINFGHSGIEGQFFLETIERKKIQQNIQFDEFLSDEREKNMLKPIRNKPFEVIIQITSKKDIEISFIVVNFMFRKKVEFLKLVCPHQYVLKSGITYTARIRVPENILSTRIAQIKASVMSHGLHGLMTEQSSSYLDVIPIHSDLEVAVADFGDYKCLGLDYQLTEVFGEISLLEMEAPKVLHGRSLPLSVTAKKSLNSLQTKIEFKVFLNFDQSDLSMSIIVEFPNLKEFPVILKINSNKTFNVTAGKVYQITVFLPNICLGSDVLNLNIMFEKNSKKIFELNENEVEVKTTNSLSDYSREITSSPVFIEGEVIEFLN